MIQASRQKSISLVLGDGTTISDLSLSSLIEYIDMEVAISLLLVFLIVVCSWIAKPLFDHLLSDWIDFGVNSDNRVTKHMMRMVESARDEMIIYDDGESDSIYGDSRSAFTEALINKCKADKNFKVRILLNCFDENLTMSKAVREERDLTNLEIRYRNGDRPNDSHFKIVDGGLLYYVSNHGQGERERKFRFFASKNKLFVPKYVKKFKKEFDLHFKKAMSFDEAYGAVGSARS